MVSSLRTLAMAAAIALMNADYAAPVMYPEGAYVNGWKKDSGKAPAADYPIRFTIAVKEQGLDSIKRVARQISDPSHANYGHYISQAQLNKLTAPKESDMASVLSWLSLQNLHFVQRGVSNIIVATNVTSASRLLKTHFHTIRNIYHNQSVVRASAYELPAEVNAAVAAVFGLHGLPIPPKQMLPYSSGGAPSHGIVTPQVITSTYKVAGVKTTHSAKNRQAVAEFDGQLMNSTDLATLFKKFVDGYTVGVDDVVREATASN